MNAEVTALKRILVPSQLYVIDKTSEIATSFYYSLVEPSVVFTITKSSTQFNKDLMWSRVNSLVYTVGIDMGVIGKRIKILENLPMWVDDTKFQSVAELCEKCRQRIVLPKIRQGLTFFIRQISTCGLA